MPSNCGARENWKSLWQQEDQNSPSLGRLTLNIHWKDWWWSWSSSILIIWSEQTTYWTSPWCGKDQKQKAKRASENEMAGQYHECNEHELRQTLGDGEGQGGLACCDSWGGKESDTTKRLNWTELNWRAVPAPELPLANTVWVRFSLY